LIKGRQVKKGIKMIKIKCPICHENVYQVNEEEVKKDLNKKLMPLVIVSSRYFIPLNSKILFPKPSFEIKCPFCKDKMYFMAEIIKKLNKVVFKIGGKSNGASKKI
jgi:phage FluMu protein Com